MTTDSTTSTSSSPSSSPRSVVYVPELPSPEDAGDTKLPQGDDDDGSEPAASAENRVYRPGRRRLDDESSSPSSVIAPMASDASAPKDPPEESSSSNRRRPLRLPCLPSDASAHILLRCDYESAASLAVVLLEEPHRRRRGDSARRIQGRPPHDGDIDEAARTRPRDGSDDADDGSLAYVWEILFHRQLFAMSASIAARTAGPCAAAPRRIHPSADAAELQNEIRYRRRLLSNLVRPQAARSTMTGPVHATPWKRSQGKDRAGKRRLGGSSSSSLPDACFTFVPIRAEEEEEANPRARIAAQPRVMGGDGNDEGPDADVDEDEDGHDEADDDPPPVPFECDCFLLLTPTSDEYLLLHPATGQFVHGAHLLGGGAVVPTARGPSNQDAAWSSDRRQHDVLVQASRSNPSRIRTANVVQNDDNDDDRRGSVHDDDIIHIGIECKHVAASDITSFHPRIGTTVVAVGRQLVREDPQVPGVDASVITEVRSWERPYTTAIDPLNQQHHESHSSSFRTFGSPRICRFRNHFFTMELVAKHHQLLVVPMMEQDDEHHDDGAAAVRAGRRDMAADAAPMPPPIDDNGNEDDPHASGSRFLHVLSFVADDVESGTEESDNAANCATFFCPPTAKIDCGDGITSLSSSGDVWVVSTVTNKLLWYDRGELVHTYSIVDCVREALRGGGAVGVVQKQETSVALPKRSKEREQLILQSLSKATAVETIRFAPFIGPDRAGFVTLSHGESTGSTILLWKKGGRSDRYEVDAVVRLPLRASRIPKVHFDGRRLLVYGEDHMGHILLVYVVQSLDDGDDGDCTTSSSGGGAGVIVSGSLRFARRIRHNAMGGLSEFDSLHVSANERFVVVNTKAGHEFAAGRNRRSSPADGLLVVDVAKAN